MRNWIGVMSVIWVIGCGSDSATPPDDEPSCENGIKDADETDVDCGGATCRKCAGGDACLEPIDCHSNNCRSDGTCYEITVSFASPIVYDAGLKPYAIVAADLDADGDLDLAVANEIESAVAVFRNDGTGAFERMPASFATGEYPTGIFAGDFDRDGVIDVITADYHGNSVSLLLGSGAGDAYTLTDATSYPTAMGAETSTLAAADLDGDDLLDVVAANPKAHSVSVLLGRGATLAPAVNLACGPDAEPYSVAIADFDGDAVPDLAIADDRSGNVLVQHGRGDGTFDLDPEAPAIEGTGSFIMVAHDMDMDGIVDLVIANRNSDDVTVLRSRGDGTFREALLAPIGELTGPYSLAIDDFNLDGVPDVITPNFMSGTATVLLGRGDGKLGEPILGGSIGEYSYGVATGDFNGDGKPDFAIANAAMNTIAVAMSTAN